MNKLVISIGSNSNDKDWQVENCIAWLKTNLSGVSTSKIYGTPASNRKDPDYLNAVMKAKCKEDFNEIQQKLKDYETVCGRTPLSKQVGDIPMDLDIVIWNGNILRQRDFNQEYFQKGWQEINH